MSTRLHPKCFGVMGTGCKRQADGRPGWMCSMQRPMSARVWVCARPPPGSLGNLFSAPWWPCLGRVMINGCFPVIYLQENGWSWPVWLEGGEKRKDETVGERGAKRKKEKESFLLRAWLGSWVSTEVRHALKCVCVRLIVYLQNFSSCCVHRGGEPLYTMLSPSNPRLAPVSGNIPEQCPLYVSILSSEKHISILQ